MRRTHSSRSCVRVSRRWATSSRKSDAVDSGLTSTSGPEIGLLGRAILLLHQLFAGLIAARWAPGWQSQDSAVRRASLTGRLNGATVDNQAEILSIVEEDYGFREQDDRFPDVYAGRNVLKRTSPADL